MGGPGSGRPRGPRRTLPAEVVAQRVAQARVSVERLDARETALVIAALADVRDSAVALIRERARCPEGGNERAWLSSRGME